MREIKLPCFGIVITLCEKADAGTITSDMHEPADPKVIGGSDEDMAHDRYEAAINGIESLILAHAVACLDVQASAYVEGIKTAVEAIGNNF